MTETTNITYSYISESLLEEYREVCEKIPKGTIQAEKQIRIDFFKSIKRDFKNKRRISPTLVDKCVGKKNSSFRKKNKKWMNSDEFDSATKDCWDELVKEPSVIRLFPIQKNIARYQFKLFWQRTIDYNDFFTNNIKKGINTSSYYDIFTYTLLALESYTKSMFTCFRCGEIAAVTKLTVKNRIAYHECGDGDLGWGNRTSWVHLYATFVKNDYYKKAIVLLDKILNAIYKKKTNEIK